MSGGDISLVLDPGLAYDAAVVLREAGYACTHVSEVGMFRSEDVEILSWAREHQSIIVTLDADFHTILAVSRASGPSVIRVRMQGLSAAAVAELVRRVLSKYRDELASGCMITVKAKKTTCHRLPVGSG